MPDKVRADGFKENRPNENVERDFGNGRQLVMKTQPEQAMKPKERRQRAGNQQQVIEMIVKESDMHMRLDEPSVRCVERAANEEQLVPQVGEPFHSNERITNPKATATAILNNTIMAL